jgi:hypothetical protein
MREPSRNVSAAGTPVGVMLAPNTTKSIAAQAGDPVTHGTCGFATGAIPQCIEYWMARLRGP